MDPVPCISERSLYKYTGFTSSFKLSILLPAGHYDNVLHGMHTSSNIMHMSLSGNSVQTLRVQKYAICLLNKLIYFAKCGKKWFCFSWDGVGNETIFWCMCYVSSPASFHLHVIFPSAPPSLRCGWSTPDVPYASIFRAAHTWVTLPWIKSMAVWSLARASTL